MLMKLNFSSVEVNALSRSFSSELGVYAVLAAQCCLVTQTFNVRLSEPKEDRKAFGEQFSHSRFKQGVKTHISKCRDVIIFIANDSRKKVGCNLYSLMQCGFKIAFPPWV